MYTVSISKTVAFQTIQFKISTYFGSIWPKDMTLSVCKLFVLERNTLYHRTVCKLFVFDRNTWYYITVCKLFVLDRNTWYHWTVNKLLVLYRNTCYHITVCKLFVFDTNTCYNKIACKLFVFDWNAWYYKSVFPKLSVNNHIKNVHPVCWGCRIRRLHNCRGVKPLVKWMPFIWQ